MPSRPRFLEPIHNVKEGPNAPNPRGRGHEKLSSSYLERWWSQSGSNRRPQACKASALPTELWPHELRRLAARFMRVARSAQIAMLKRAPRALRVAMVGRVGVEPTTSRLSGVRSNHLSYRPPLPRSHKGRGRREPAQAALPYLLSGSNRCFRSYDPSAGKRFQDEGT